MSCTTRTCVWINDTNWTTCATHALPSLVDQFRRAEERGDVIVWDAHGSWMRAYADDARAAGLRCFYCD